MATIYRFIVENKSGNGGGGKNPKTDIANPKSAGKKGKQTTSLFSYMTNSGKGGVEHNRKMRAINPLLNKMTGGAWEKANRLGRAGLGLIQVDKSTGALAGFSAVAIAIIISFIIQTVLKIQARDRAKAEAANERNYKALENGFGSIHGQYTVSTNLWDGRRTYNQNK